MGLFKYFFSTYDQHHGTTIENNWGKRIECKKQIVGRFLLVLYRSYSSLR